MRVLACAYYTPSFLKINRLIEHSLFFESFVDLKIFESFVDKKRSAPLPDSRKCAFFVIFVSFVDLNVFESLVPFVDLNILVSFVDFRNRITGVHSTGHSGTS